MFQGRRPGAVLRCGQRNSTEPDRPGGMNFDRLFKTCSTTALFPDSGPAPTIRQGGERKAPGLTTLGAISGMADRTNEASKPTVPIGFK
jgi:hypothetical protein